MRVLVFTGAGISAESGLKTFRATDGLWEEHRVEDVATPEAFRRNPELVLRFYNERRCQVLNAAPNEAHLAIADMEDHHHVDVVTQNIDDLHERAGSTRVLHLHGEINKARSTANERIVLPLNGPSLGLGDLCPLGSQLRPHIVWFGEGVPMMEPALELARKCDVLLVVGTSLNVYPAANLLCFAPQKARIYVIDPGEVPLHRPGVDHRKTKASVGVPQLAFELCGRT
ncbi:MAG: NAD-dependent deacylase [Flavobacteriales bacterium]|nr:MAG: NAD-dependent deacylase [Flavobacteriales bacterium]